MVSSHEFSQPLEPMISMTLVAATSDRTRGERIRRGLQMHGCMALPPVRMAVVDLHDWTIPKVGWGQEAPCPARLCVLSDQGTALSARALGETAAGVHYTALWFGFSGWLFRHAEEHVKEDRDARH
eukprot:scaffold54879_cov68-Phaeocystis_antarctica.AAC.3